MVHEFLDRVLVAFIDMLINEDLKAKQSHRLKQHNDSDFRGWDTSQCCCIRVSSYLDGPTMFSPTLVTPIKR
jgi:hypothetical protein